MWELWVIPLAWYGSWGACPGFSVWQTFCHNLVVCTQNIPLSHCGWACVSQLTPWPCTGHHKGNIHGTQVSGTVPRFLPQSQHFLEQPYKQETCWSVCETHPLRSSRGCRQSIWTGWMQSSSCDARGGLFLWHIHNHSPDTLSAPSHPSPHTSSASDIQPGCPCAVYICQTIWSVFSQHLSDGSPGKTIINVSRTKWKINLVFLHAIIIVTFLHMLQTYLMSWCRAVHWRLCFQASL